MKGLFDKICQAVIAVLLLAVLVIFVHHCGEEPIQTDNLQRINDSLQVETLKRDSIIKVSALKVTELQKKDSLLSQENQKLKARIAMLNVSKEALESEMAKISTDSIYLILQDTYTTTDTLLRYPFSSGQIRSIYITSIEHTNLIYSDSAYMKLVEVMDKQLVIKDNVIAEKDKQIIQYKEQSGLKDQIITNDNQVIKSQKAEINRQKRNKVLWQIGAGVAGVVAIAALL